MQKKLVLNIIIILFFLNSLVCIPLNAIDVPGLPHQFYGYAFNEEGKLIPNGNVSAVLGDVTYTTPIFNGTFGFPLITESFSFTGDSGDQGEIIYFYINDTITDQTARFQAGGINDDYSQYLNLSFDTDPPIISSISVNSITSSEATISWITNELSNSTVAYGSTINLGQIKKDANFVTNHEMLLSNLNSETKYYFTVHSYDPSGNLGTDDNSSNFYFFTTDEESQNNGGNGGNGGAGPGGNGGDIPPIKNNSENLAPISNAGGPYFSIINQDIIFDGSNSKDYDGYIIEYLWDFGDLTNVSTDEIIISHSYSEIGNYSITLTVRDNNGSSSISTTYANVTSEDIDGDGWSNSAEEFYNTNSTDPNDYPIDNDGDRVPDGWDSDDDNDGLVDTIEDDIGTNSKDSTDVLRKITEVGIFYLIDTNDDGKYNKYYNQTNGLITDLYIDNNYYLIDVNNDSIYDYMYDIVSNEISIYQNKSIGENPDNNFIIYLIIVIIVIAIIKILYLIMKKNRGGKK